MLFQGCLVVLVLRSWNRLIGHKLEKVPCRQYEHFFATEEFVNDAAVASQKLESHRVVVLATLTDVDAPELLLVVEQVILRQVTVHKFTDLIKVPDHQNHILIEPVRVFVAEIRVFEPWCRISPVSDEIHYNDIVFVVLRPRCTNQAALTDSPEVSDLLLSPEFDFLAWVALELLLSMAEFALDVTGPIPELQNAGFEDFDGVVREVAHLLLNKVMHVALREVDVRLLARADAAVQLVDTLVLREVMQNNQRSWVQYLVNRRPIVLVLLLVVVTSNCFVEVLHHRVVNRPVQLRLHLRVGPVKLAPLAYCRLQNSIHLTDVSRLLESEGTFWVLLCPLHKVAILFTRVNVLFFFLRAA